jgi:RNA polymerase sigma-70 factor, ECF subfamily
MTVTNDWTLTANDSLESTVTFEMDEDAFRAFYERTARPLWSYLSRISGDSQVADDLLQEAYYRFLRTKINWDGESHRRAYLFRIATNLVRDGHRRGRSGRIVPLPDTEREELGSSGADVAERLARREDLRRAMERLRPRDRALLWLAYAQGHAHTEIAATLGVKTGSVKPLLFRARRKLADLLRAAQARTSGGSRENR